jgi:hypothetical protein
VNLASERLPFLPWSGILVVALHNLEEALTTPKWLPLHRNGIAAATGIQPPAPAPHVLYASLIVVTLLPALWLLLASRARRKSLCAYSCLVLLGIFFANAFVPHILGALSLRSYVPGLVTAVGLVIPFFLAFVSRGLASGYFSGLGALAATAAAVIVYALLGVGALHLFALGAPSGA